ncbi:transposase [Haloferula sargassicola]|uniref:Transposase IS200-like domain-containing protein n=1 Tax=Haloferula sargassicola TaxID=490096 RepID=A0ABP9USY5_9BACT
MARKPRYQAAGAIYHVMARGEGGKDVFEEDVDRKVWLERLGEACGRFGWRVHAWVQMGNHFHLLLETPQPNLVAGMKWFMGVYSQWWNIRRKRRGHVFQGRYKAVVVSGEGKGRYFRIVADYIHLNPVRSGWVGGTTERKVVGWRWSSLPQYAGRKGCEWVETRRVLRAFELEEGGLAYLMRTRTGVSNAWVAERLSMGHPGGVSRAVRKMKESRSLIRRAEGLLMEK